MNEEIEKIEKLLEEGKKEEVKEILTNLVSKPLTEEERGEGLVKIMSLYLDVQNNINERYKKELEEIMADIDEANKEKKELEDEEKLGAVKKDLGI